MSENITAVVVGRNYSTSLGIIRALGSMGVRVRVAKQIGATPRHLSPELVSRYVSGFEYFKHDNEQALLEVLLEKFAADGIKKLLIPADDFCASAIERNYDVLKEHFYVPMASGTAGRLTELMDKSLQKELAEQCGLCVAKGWSVEIDKKGNYNIPNTIKFPCFTKPQISIGSPKSYIKKCDNKEQLDALLKDISKYGEVTILVEEYLEIEKEFVVPGAALGKEICAPAFIEKIKIGSGHRKGVTKMGRVCSSENYADTLNKLRAFLSQMDFHGLFDIELIYANSKIYFNELNLRNSAATFAVTAAGCNLPFIHAEDLVFSKPAPENIEIKEGLVFASEKVEFDDYLAGYSSYSQYKKDLKSADIRFIKNKDDPAPYKAFLRMFFKSQLKKLLRR